LECSSPAKFACKVLVVAAWGKVMNLEQSEVVAHAKGDGSSEKVDPNVI
jgi:hypothetical protein